MVIFNFNFWRHYKNTIAISITHSITIDTKGAALYMYTSIINILKYILYSMNLLLTSVRFVSTLKKKKMGEHSFEIIFLESMLLIFPNK
jgi:hypothetical protein